MREIVQTIFIDSAHRLSDSPDLITKKCCCLHGHTYKITLTFSGNVNKDSGLFVDFSATKDIVNQLDHKFLNEIFDSYAEWRGVNTTAENIARFLYEKIKSALPQIKKLKVDVVEGFKGDDSPHVIYEK